MDELEHVPTPEEKDASQERLKEEDAQRYPSHEDPKKLGDPGEARRGRDRADRD